MTFDISKPYRCRNGAEAKVIPMPNGRFVGWRRSHDCEPQAEYWFSDGRVFGGGVSAHDLINLPPEPEILGWLNIYPIGEADFYSNRAAAQRNVGPGLLECRPIYREAHARADAQAARIVELEKALEPFAKIKPSTLYSADGSEAEPYIVTLKAGLANHAEFTGADLAGARSALASSTTLKGGDDAET